MSTEDTQNKPMTPTLSYKSAGKSSNVNFKHMLMIMLMTKSQSGGFYQPETSDLQQVCEINRVW